MIVATTNQLEKAVRYLGAIPGAAERAMARALNGAAVAGREKAIDAIGERYAVQASDVRDRITLTKATPKELQVSVVARSKSLSLTYFPHSPKMAGTGGRGKPQLRAEVIRGQVKPVQGAFVATIAGRPRIMIRTGRKTATGKTEIRSVLTVPIANMLAAPTVRQAVEVRALEALDKHLDQAIDRELGSAA